MGACSAKPNNISPSANTSPLHHATQKRNNYTPNLSPGANLRVQVNDPSPSINRKSTSNNNSNNNHNKNRVVPIPQSSQGLQLIQSTSSHHTATTDTENYGLTTNHDPLATTSRQSSFSPRNQITPNNIQIQNRLSCPTNILNNHTVETSSSKQAITPTHNTNHNSEKFTPSPLNADKDTQEKSLSKKVTKITVLTAPGVLRKLDSHTAPTSTASSPHISTTLATAGGSGTTSLRNKIVKPQVIKRRESQGSSSVNKQGERPKSRSLAENQLEQTRQLLAFKNSSFHEEIIDVNSPLTTGSTSMGSTVLSLKTPSPDPADDPRTIFSLLKEVSSPMRSPEIPPRNLLEPHNNPIQDPALDTLEQMTKSD